LLLLVVTASAVLVPLTSAGASTKKHPVSYFALHPCSLVTKAQVESIFAGAPMAPPQASPNPFGGSCAYTTTGTNPNANVNWEFSAGSASSAKKFVKKPLTAEKSVGHNAFCSANGGLYADAGTLKGAPSQLIMAAGNCATDVAFAKAAFKNLS
jgi:hypothetical protein